MTLGTSIRSTAFVLLALGLVLGASWLAYGPWWQGSAVPAEHAGDEGLGEDGTPTLAGLGAPPTDPSADPEPVDPEALLAAFEGQAPKQQMALLALVPGPLPYHERLAAVLLSSLEVNRGAGNWTWRRALARMVPAPVEQTLALTRHARWQVRVEAIFLLATWRARGDDVPPLPLRDLLEDPKAQVRRAAGRLGAVGVPYDPDLASWLLDQIQPGDRGPNWAPEVILVRMGPEGLALLLPLLHSRDAALRMQALWGLRAAHVGDLRPHLATVAAMIGDEDEDVRVAAIQALSPLEGDCEVCLPALIEALRDESTLVLRAALLVIEQMGPRAAPAVSALVALLDYDVDDRVAKRAASVLGDMKAHPDRVLPALSEALHGDTPDAAAAALAQFGPPALPHALRVFETGDEDARYAALHVFEILGPAASAVAPRLPALIAGDDIEMAQRAIAVAGRIGPDAAVALPAILERVWEADIIAPDRWAAEILMAFGAPAEHALREGLRAKDPARCETALRVVERCWGRSAFALPELEPLLSAADAERRRRAVAAVCVSLSDEAGDVEVSRTSDPALRARVRELLERVRQDEDGDIRDWARDVIAQIDALQKG